MAEARPERTGTHRTRRGILRAAVVGAAAFTGCLKPSLDRIGASRNTSQTTTSPAREGGTVTVSVAPDSEFGFSPGTASPLRITAGTTVRFVWRTDTHNIVVDHQPDGANWDGTDGAPDSAYDSGYEHEHTFSVAGTYRFHCAPHESLGATGVIEVVADGTETGSEKIIIS